VAVPVDFSLWDQEVSPDNVTDETVLMGGTAAIPLARQDLTTVSEVVTAVGGSPVYETPRDYIMDYVSGTISRVDGGFILDGTTIEIDYEWTSYGSMLWSESQLVDVFGGLRRTILSHMRSDRLFIFHECFSIVFSFVILYYILQLILRRKHQILPS